jgi:hypothetical protein
MGQKDMEIEKYKIKSTGEIVSGVVLENGDMSIEEEFKYLLGVFRVLNIIPFFRWDGYIFFLYDSKMDRYWSLGSGRLLTKDKILFNREEFESYKEVITVKKEFDVLHLDIHNKEHLSYLSQLDNVRDVSSLGDVHGVMIAVNNGRAHLLTTGSDVIIYCNTFYAAG